MDELINTGLSLSMLVLAILTSVGVKTMWCHFTFKEKCGATCFVLFLFTAGILVAYIGGLPNGSNVSKTVHGITSLSK